MADELATESGQAPAQSARVRSRVGFASPLVVTLALALVLGGSLTVGPWGLLVPIGVAAWQVVLWLRDQDGALTTMRARPAHPESEARLIDMVNRLADRAGVSRPRAFVCDVPGANAFATATRSGGIVAVTASALDILPDDELEAVMAHEVGHLKNRDTFWMHVSHVVRRSVFILVAAVAVLVGIGLSLLFALVNDKNDRKFEQASSALTLMITGSIAIAGSIVSQAMMLAVSRNRELLADQTAADLAHPTALVRALERIEAHDSGAQPVTPKMALVAPLLLMNPYRATWWERLFQTHPSLATRARRLESRIDPSGRDEFRRAREGAARAMAHSQAERIWQTEVDRLERVSAYTASAHPRPQSDWERCLFRLTSGEQVYWCGPAELIELRHRDGHGVFRVTQRGDAAVTTRGLVFAGTKRTRWDFATIIEREWQTDPDGAVVLMQTTTRRKPSGLLFVDPDEPMSLVVEVAEADARHRREELLAALDTELRMVRAKRPQPPTE